MTEVPVREVLPPTRVDAPDYTPPAPWPDEAYVDRMGGEHHCDACDLDWQGPDTDCPVCGADG